MKVMVMQMNSYANEVTEEIESHPERVSNIKTFINKYNWKGINYPPNRHLEDV